MIFPNGLTEEQTHDADVDYRGDEEKRDRKEREMKSLVSFDVVRELWHHHILSETRTPRGLRLNILMTYGEAKKLVELLKKAEVEE